MKTCLISVDFKEKERARITALLKDYRILWKKTAEVEPGDLADVEFIIGNVKAELLPDTVRWMQLQSAGFDRYPKEMLPKELILTHASGAYGKALAEHSLAVTLALIKQLPGYRDQQNQNLWKDLGPVRSISGNKVVILGFGDLGRHYADLLHKLGNQIYALRNTTTDTPSYLNGSFFRDELTEHLKTADIVALFLPSSPATRHLFSRNEFKVLNPGAILINAGRGDAVDTEALLEALRENRLWAAGLDVFEEEPLPPDHPLWRDPRVLLTPHIAGAFHLEDTYLNVSEIIISNIKNYLEHKELTHQAY